MKKFFAIGLVLILFSTVAIAGLKVVPAGNNFFGRQYAAWEKQARDNDKVREAGFVFGYGIYHRIPLEPWKSYLDSDQEVAFQWVATVTPDGTMVFRFDREVPRIAVFRAKKFGGKYEGVGKWSQYSFSDNGIAVIYTNTTGMLQRKMDILARNSGLYLVRIYVTST